MIDPQQKKITVLLVEDSSEDAGLIKAHLAAATGRPRFEVRHVVRLSDALRALQDVGADIIVLDLTLPGSEGLETLLAMRQAASRIPIVIVSGRADEQLALEAVRRGAQDFFPKDEAFSDTLGRSLQYTIERYHRERAEREIESAAFVQRRLYPKPLPQLATMEVAGRCVSANQVGGDYFDYFMPDQQNLMLVIGDVSGHGFGPSLVMVETRAALRTMATTTDDIGVMIRQVNELLHQEDVGKFVTLFLARVDITTGICHYAAAGHPAELIRADGSTQTLDSQEPSLGLRREPRFEVRQVQLQLHDQVLLYTDGVSERSSANSELFGVARMRDLIAGCRDLSAKEGVDRLFDAANQFADHRAPVDDMTAIILKVTSDF